MDMPKIRERLTNAVNDLLKGQPDLFSFTSETKQTEWNISQHLGNEIQKNFPEYRCDPELLKPDAGNKRPDFVLHMRGTHINNFLVIELKRSKNNVERESRKIKNNWFIEPYKYQFGAVIVINEKEGGFVYLIQNTNPASL